MAVATYRLPFSPNPEICRMVSPSHRKSPNSWWCVDFYMPELTPVRAVRSGVAIQRESRYNTYHRNRRDIAQGNGLFIGHDDGTVAVYGHLAWRSVFPKLGEWVRAGQVIGLSGWTGYASYPHLHFGMYDADLKCIRINWSRHARENMPAYQAGITLSAQ
jgi:murein DD-endopeptidase MepM/ murein hydrolase activator NlpD